MLVLKVKDCEICGSKFYNRRKNGQSLGDSQFLKARFCSIECSGKNQIGKNKPLHTREWKRRQSKCLKRQHASGMRKNIFTPEIRKKMSDSRLNGIRDGRIDTRKGIPNLKISGKNNYNWKGKGVGYCGLHYWVKNKLGSPSKCAYCLTIKARKFEWCSIDHKYKRNLSDWIRLCTKCHRNYDYGNIKILNRP